MCAADVCQSYRKPRCLRRFDGRRKRLCLSVSVDARSMRTALWWSVRYNPAVIVPERLNSKTDYDLEVSESPRNSL